MRAEYYKDLEQIKDQDILKLDEELLHHLVKVVRLNQGEKILLLNGKGLSMECVVSNVSKKSLELKKLSVQEGQDFLGLSLAIGICKRDAMELILKQAVELGVKEIIPLQTDFSHKFFLKPERVESLMISALKQSNNLYFPDILSSSKIENLDFKNYSHALYFTPPGEARDHSFSPSPKDKTLLIIGPEGGFSQKEDHWIAQQKNVTRISLATPILRAPTAVAAAIGWYHGKCC